jgi:hypothetical protein
VQSDNLLKLTAGKRALSALVMRAQELYFTEASQGEGRHDAEMLLGVFGMPFCTSLVLPEDIDVACSKNYNYDVFIYNYLE